MYFSATCGNKVGEKKVGVVGGGGGGECWVKMVFFKIVPYKKNMPSFPLNKSRQRASQGGIFNYSLLPTSQSGRVALH